MRPLLEKVVPLPGESWAILNRRLEHGLPFQWHHHPEFELTLTLNSRGERFIGDHIGSYDDGDLVLIGPNLPHTWSSREKIDPTLPHVALVMWFHPNWAAPLGTVFSELRAVRQLLDHAKTGLKFSSPSGAGARPLIEALFLRPPAERLISLLAVLTHLARDDAAEPLSSPLAAASTATGDRSRLDRVLDHIHTHYDEGLSIAGLADIAALSPSGLQRLVRRHTGTTVSLYMMRLRIGQACALLSSTDRPIAHIATDVGYDSLANFNRQFKALKAMTPRDYRRRFEPSS